MKARYIIFLLFLCFSSAKAQSQSFELQGLKIDTINKIDIKNQKQGIWIIKGRHQIKKIQAGYQPDQTIETGMYMNNRKEGVWIEYYKNGKTRSKLTYVNGTLNGAAVFFDEAEKVRSQGAFKDNKWLNGQ